MRGNFVIIFSGKSNSEGRCGFRRSSSSSNVPAAADMAPPSPSSIVRTVSNQAIKCPGSNQRNVADFVLILHFFAPLSGASAELSHTLHNHSSIQAMSLSGGARWGQRCTIRRKKQDLSLHASCHLHVLQSEKKKIRHGRKI